MKTITVFLLTLLLVLPSAVVFADDVQYNGNIRVSGAIAENSDGRLNRNIVPLSDTLSKLDQLRGVVLCGEKYFKTKR